MKSNIRKYYLILVSIIFPIICFSQEKLESYSFSSLKDRDPLRPLVSEQGEILLRAKKATGEIILQGLICSDQERSVVVDNELLSEGDQVQGYKVKTIAPYQVIFEKDGAELVVRWESE